jgi:hypothetical protein
MQRKASSSLVLPRSKPSAMLVGDGRGRALQLVTQTKVTTKLVPLGEGVRAPGQGNGG